MPRIAIALILVSLLASCPIACGTAHAAACGHGGERHGSDHRDRSDMPAPANDDDCICNGAIKSADASGICGLDCSSSVFDALPPSIPSVDSTRFDEAAASIELPPPRASSSGLRRTVLRC